MKNESMSEDEKLLLRQWDSPLPSREAARLNQLLAQDATLIKLSGEYLKIREHLVPKEQETFGPYFAERIINLIKKRTEELDYLIFFFFRKYRAVALGIFVALLTTNIILADQLSIASVFGLEEEGIDDIIGIDLYQNLNP